MADAFRTLICTAADAPLARAIAASFGPGGEGMWTTGLSADGAAPATHYVSTGYIPEQFAYLVPCQTWAMDEQGQWVETGEIPGNPQAVYQLAQDAGIECTQAEIDALFADSDVTEQEPFTAFGRLGLQIAQAGEESSIYLEGHA